MTGKRKRVLPGWMRDIGSSCGAVSVDLPKPSWQYPRSPTDPTLSSDNSSQRDWEDVAFSTSRLQEKVEPDDTCSEMETITDLPNSKEHQRPQPIEMHSDEEDEPKHPHSSPLPRDSPLVMNESPPPSSRRSTNCLNSSDDSHPNTPGRVASDNSPSPNNNVTSLSSRHACIYASSCYRKNPQHRKDFSHPGDADYIEPSSSTSNSSPINDKRPLCKYGATCYRKNPQHRLDFSHDVSNKRKARPPDLQDLVSDEEEEDYGEYSDDYKPGDSETDDSFVTSDSMASGESDFDPDKEEDEEGENASKKKQKPITKTKKKRKKEKN